MVFTSGARHQIKRWLNQQEKIKSISLGKKIWEKEAKKSNLPTECLNEDALLGRLGKILPFKLKSLDHFYALIGLGKIVINRKFMAKLVPAAETVEKKQDLLRKFMERVGRKPRPEAEAKGTSWEFVSLARCCSPIKGEPIIGYMTSGKGITIHSTRCPLVTREVLDSERMVEVSWDEGCPGPFKSRILIRAVDRPGLLAKVATAIAQLQGNITKAEVLTSADEKAQIKLRLVIRDIQQLEEIIKKIGKIKEVLSVERT